LLYPLNELDGLIKGTQIKLSSSRTRKIEEKDEGIKIIKKKSILPMIIFIELSK